MSLHIGAESGAIAETVFLCGDPLRAKFIAEKFLEDVTCYTSVRNMLGFTGTYRGKRISVQGTGMGQPSLAIYVNELLNSYGAKILIRLGTCGAIRPEINLGEVIIAQGACTDSSLNKLRFNQLDFAPLADFNMLFDAVTLAKERGIEVRVGNVFSTDYFYATNDPERWEIWQKHGVLCAEMESAMLYTLAAGASARALSILTVSDNIMTGEFSSSEDREKSYTEMVELAFGLLNNKG